MTSGDGDENQNTAITTWEWFRTTNLDCDTKLAHEKIINLTGKALKYLTLILSLNSNLKQALIINNNEKK